MKISKFGQVTIPKKLRFLFGLNQGVEVDILPTDDGLLIRKRSAAQHPVERTSGIHAPSFDVDQYVEEVRGR